MNAVDGSRMTRLGSEEERKEEREREGGGERERGGGEKERRAWERQTEQSKSEQIVSTVLNAWKKSTSNRSGYTRSTGLCSTDE